MNEKLDIKSTGQHWKKNNDYWCSFDYDCSLYVIKCRLYKRENKEDILKTQLAKRYLNWAFDGATQKVIDKFDEQRRTKKN